MKKFFIAASLLLAMAACGGQSDNVNDEIQKVEQLGAEAKAAINKDATLKALVDKSAKGEELTSEEKQTLLQKLKAIAADVVVGDKTASQGAKDATNAVKDSEELKNATAPAAQKVEETKAKVEETKAKAEEVQNAANALKDAVNNLKK